MLSVLYAGVESAIRQLGEVLSYVQETGGTWVTASQTVSAGTVTTTSVSGVTKMIRTGIDGVSVQAGDMDVWLSRRALDAASLTPAVGDSIVTGSTRLVVLEVEANEPGGYTRCRARAAV
jgi:hypothetical protein